MKQFENSRGSLLVSCYYCFHEFRWISMLKTCNWLLCYLPRYLGHSVIAFLAQGNIIGPVPLWSHYCQHITRNKFKLLSKLSQFLGLAIVNINICSKLQSWEYRPKTLSRGMSAEDKTFCCCWKCSGMSSKSCETCRIAPVPLQNWGQNIKVVVCGMLFSLWKGTILTKCLPRCNLQYILL